MHYRLSAEIDKCHFARKGTDQVFPLLSLFVIRILFPWICCLRYFCDCLFSISFPLLFLPIWDQVGSGMNMVAAYLIEHHYEI
jgi:hypothetical protein